MATDPSSPLRVVSCDWDRVGRGHSDSQCGNGCLVAASSRGHLSGVPLDVPAGRSGQHVPRLRESSMIASQSELEPQVYGVGAMIRKVGIDLPTELDGRGSGLAVQ